MCETTQYKWNITMLIYDITIINNVEATLISTETFNRHHP